MTFQFLCPQGHLLEGEEAHMGMQCECPQCGTAFIIPTVGAAEQPAAPANETAPAPADPTAEIDVEVPRPIDALQQLEEAAKGASPISVGPADDDSDPRATDDSDFGPVGDPALDDEVLLHIPCPNGQRAKGPHCGVEFRLRREKSIEYLRHEEMLERRRAKFWFQLDVVAASFVGVVILAMIVMLAFS